MKNWWRRGLLMALYLPLIAIPILRLSDGKEVRPSDHGLPHQGEEQANAPQMSSFFGSGASSTTQPLPEAKNFSDPSWSSSGRVGGADHVRKALIVSSLVCGIAGIVLLVAAGILFLHRFRNRRSTR